MTDYGDCHEGLVEDAIAMANAIVVAKVSDPDGPTAKRLIDSVRSEMTRDLPDGMSMELEHELIRRSVRPTVMVNVIAEMIARVILAAQRAGIDVSLENLESPYTALMELEDL